MARHAQKEHVIEQSHYIHALKKNLFQHIQAGSPHKITLAKTQRRQSYQG